MEKAERLRAADGLAVAGRAHALGPQAARRVGVISPFNFPMALCRRAGRRRADRRQHGRPQAHVGRPADGLQVRRGAARRRHRRRRLQPGHRARARRSAPSSRRTPDIDGMVFTGSYEVGMKLYTGFTKDYPRPIITEMGGKNPAIVTATPTSTRPPRASCAPHSASTGRSAAPTAGSTSSGRWRGHSSTSWSSGRRPSGSATRPQRENWMGPVINQKALDKFTDGRGRGKGRWRARSRSAARSCRRRAERGYFPMPDRGHRPADSSHRLFRDELFVPFLVVGEVDSLDEALRESNATRLRPDGRHLQPRRRSRSSASWTRSRPASCT